MQSNILLKQLKFEGKNKHSEINFNKGINVVCGASDTGKSFVAEAIDYMFGRKELRQITELENYNEIFCDFCISSEKWILKRDTSGGSFIAKNITNNEEVELLKQHNAKNEKNISSFFLNKIGLKNKRIKKNQSNGTQYLSFRDVSRIIVVQENEIHKEISPLITGQHTNNTANFSSVKLFLTGKDDSSLVETKKKETTSNSSVIERMVRGLENKLDGSSFTELSQQLSKLEGTISEQEVSLQASKVSLAEYSKKREKLFEEKASMERRISEIDSLLSRFSLLSEHYDIDIRRLESLEESAHLFQNTQLVDCPSCGAEPQNQISYHKPSCELDFTSIITASQAEISKIQRLSKGLNSSKKDLNNEVKEIKVVLNNTNSEYSKIEEFIRETLSPSLLSSQNDYSSLVKLRYEIKRKMEHHEQLEKLKAFQIAPKSNASMKEIDEAPEVFEELSMVIANILKKWGIYSECKVQFDLKSKDFLINNKPRGSTGKGLRALTHSAVTIAILEYCQKKQLPHPGLIILDSPLLAFFEADDPDGNELKSKNVNDKFYTYLKKHHSNNQIIIIENEQPSIEITQNINVIYFSGNPEQDRAGLL